MAISSSTVVPRAEGASSTRGTGTLTASRGASSTVTPTVVAGAGGVTTLEEDAVSSNRGSSPPEVEEITCARDISSLATHVRVAEAERRAAGDREEVVAGCRQVSPTSSISSASGIVGRDPIKVIPGSLTTSSSRSPKLVASSKDREDVEGANGSSTSASFPKAVPAASTSTVGRRGLE
ncbi:hypothetical protein C2845_PM15G08240 [Panicum miliaceum]|uniref:Uncharacterized protein n=1 Tax=Panicum miliaceum TaxID=4540 RepID=A0A3L6Q638_PANMI|nr:hypothetical protein C2845_PM15G08240 [Panicum miliaceum]